MGNLMTKVSTYTSRYGDERVVWQETANSYLIEGRTHYMRFSTRAGDSNTLSMADFEGGPYIELGMPAGLVLNNRTRKQVTAIEQVDTGDAQRACIRIRVGGGK